MSGLLSADASGRKCDTLLLSAACLAPTVPQDARYILGALPNQLA